MQVPHSRSLPVFPEFAQILFNAPVSYHVMARSQLKKVNAHKYFKSIDSRLALTFFSLLFYPFIIILSMTIKTTALRGMGCIHQTLSSFSTITIASIIKHIYSESNTKSTSKCFNVFYLMVLNFSIINWFGLIRASHQNKTFGVRPWPSHHN